MADLDNTRQYERSAWSRCLERPRDMSRGSHPAAVLLQAGVQPHPARHPCTTTTRNYTRK